MSLSRKLFIENLEGRRVLSADFGLDVPGPDQELSEPQSHHNAIHPTDVNDDQLTSPIDALLVINSINAEQSIDQVAHMCDTNGDGSLSPLDALMVINELNSVESGGETRTDDVEDLDDSVEDDDLEEDIGESEGEQDDTGDDTLGSDEDNENDDSETGDSETGDSEEHQPHRTSIGRNLRIALLGRGDKSDQAIASLFDQFDENGDDSLTEEEVPRFAWTFLLDNGVDANQDDAISLDEIEERLVEERLERFEEIDDDGDGLLTAAELTDRQWERLGNADLNDDGVSFDELEAFRALTRFEKLDSNGDEQITADEVSERLWDRLERFDANDDNAIASDEFPTRTRGEQVTSRLTQIAARFFRFARRFGA